MEGSSADFYEFSPSELLVLEKWFAGGKRRFIAQPHYHLDIDAKMAALKISPSIVSLISFSGDQVLSQASGTIIETQQNYNFVMTSLYLVRPRRSASKSAKNRLAHNLKVVVRASDENSYVGKIHVYDFHYNILLIKFKSKSPFPCARLRNPENSFQLHPHSLKLKPGDPIVIVGKYFYCDCEFMAASGSFSMRDGLLDDYGCGELLSVTCRSPCSGDGGPLIDLGGQVMGITYHEIGPYRCFLPINIVYKWWEHYKCYMEFRHPSYGIEANDIYAANLYILEKLMKKFPISNGVVVQKVLPASYAQRAGLRENDVILKCDGKAVKGFLELWDRMFEKVGQTVDLEVARVSLDALKTLTMVVGEAIPKKLNK